jgi:hypothetical protein
MELSTHLVVHENRECWPPEFPVDEAAVWPSVAPAHKHIVRVLSGLFDFQGLIVEHKAADKTTETKALFDGTPRPRELLQYDVILELWVD